MSHDVYLIDAFADTPFSGNPAAVVPLDRWLPDAVMQSIAMEFNLSETAFMVAEGDGYRIRWFTPATEVRLCGHATLAAAWVLLEELAHPQDAIDFASLSGPLAVTRVGERLVLDFPAQPARTCAIPASLVDGLHAAPVTCLRGGDDIVVVLDTQDDVAALAPDFAQLARVDARGVIATAPGDHVDFVLRFFAPAVGINEDPVTGSAYTVAAPYWAEKSGKSILQARQISRRGGDVHCVLEGDRVKIGGRARKFMQGMFELPADVI